MKIISRESYKRATWKNGLGFTDEIAIYPPQAALAQGNFLWRLSSAHITQASAFSVFPNHDRVLVVLKGNGVKLSHVFEEGELAEVVDLPPLEPYEFPGDIQSKCELQNGPITDLSIFLRKAEVESQTQIKDVTDAEDFEWVPEGRWNFAFVVQGQFESDQGTVIEGNTLAFERMASDAPPVAARLRLAAGSKILFISLA